MEDKQIILNWLGRDIISRNYYEYAVLATTKQDWDNYNKEALFYYEIDFKNADPKHKIELKLIGNSLQEAETWLDTHSWELLEIEIASSRPVLEIKEERI
jgi:outer membrane lipoprotein-sorting protein